MSDARAARRLPRRACGCWSSATASPAPRPRACSGRSAPRWSRSPTRRARTGGDGRAFVRDGRETSLLAIVLDRGKRIVDAGSGTELAALLERGIDGAPFDVVIVDVVLGRRGPLAAFADVASYAAFVAAHNPRAWVTISAFGLSGDRADDIATELTVAAAGGMLAAARDQDTGRPAQARGPAVVAEHRPGRCARRVPRPRPHRVGRTRAPRPLRDRGDDRDRTGARGRRSAPQHRQHRRRQALRRAGQLLHVPRRPGAHLGDGGPPVAGRGRGDGLAAVGRALRDGGSAHRVGRAGRRARRGVGTRLHQAGRGDAAAVARGARDRGVLARGDPGVAPARAPRSVRAVVDRNGRGREGRRPAVPRRGRRRERLAPAVARVGCGCSKRAACSRCRSRARSSARSGPRSRSSRTCRGWTCTAGAVRTSTARPAWSGRRTSR